MKKIAVLLFVIVVIVAGCGNVDLPQNEAVNHQNPPDRKPLNDEPADKNVPANNTDTNEITKEEIERFFSEEDTDMDFIAQKLSEPGWYERFMYQAIRFTGLKNRADGKRKPVFRYCPVWNLRLGCISCSLEKTITADINM